MPSTTLMRAFALSLLCTRVDGEFDTPKPHILFILVDDLGHANLGFHREVKTKEVQTPRIDQLLNDGVNLDRHYVHKFCSPTRCAIQSGRAPIHVNVINADPSVHNPADPVGGFAGIPRNMTGMAEVLKRAGYATHFAGKWDAGMATPDHTPEGRGYDTTLSYFHHANDYYTFKTGLCNGKPVTDLWNLFDGRLAGPAIYLKNGPNCTVQNQKPEDGQKCMYEDSLFENRVTKVIQDHTNKQNPLFVFWATHIVHGPLQVPDAELAKFNFIDDKARQTYHAMVNWIDGAIGRVVDVLHAEEMYNNTLIVFSSDNGGPISGGANNYPLKGGKFSNWEGGIRVNAFVSGGFVPVHMRGSVNTQLVAGWDWYATLAALAGEDPTDHRAAAAGLPPIDSHNLWPMLSGQTATSPRTQLEIGSNLGGDEANRTSGATRVGGLIVPPYKIILGWGQTDDSAPYLVDMAGWPGPQNPNTTSNVDWQHLVQQCGRTPATGCLYNVWEDPEEHHNLAAAQPTLFASMMEQALRISVYSPTRGTSTDGLACQVAADNGNFWGPFLP